MIHKTLASHRIENIRHIYQGRLSSYCCDAVAQAYDDAEKIDNTGKNQDNLYKTERTGWRMHEDKRVFNIMQQITDMFGKMVCNEIPSYFEGVGINLFECWIARSQDGSLVEPHNHGSNLNLTQWSVVFYANIPSETTSLVFFDSYIGKKIQLDVREGDFIIFPSDILHYTTDTCEGRMILSGNLSMSLREDLSNG